MDMLESNYRTWCAQNDVVLEDGPIVDATNDGLEAMDMDGASVGDEDEWDGIMDIDEDEDLPDFFKAERDRTAESTSKGQTKRKRKGKVAELVREKIRRVLEDQTQLGERRARLCDEGDFLKLLYNFNQEGIHFN